MEIKQISQNQLPECLDLIHSSFKTVADRFSFTKENCSGHTSFMTIEKLQRFWDWGFLMFGLYNEMNKLKGYVSISKVPDRDGVYTIHNLCVLPKDRKNGYGKFLLDFSKDKARELKGDILFIDFIEEDIELRNWYIKNGFEHKGVKHYEHLPFTVGNAEYKL
jgi:diamine N-acetyltransferase